MSVPVGVEFQLPWSETLTHLGKSYFGLQKHFHQHQQMHYNMNQCTKLHMLDLTE